MQSVQRDLASAFEAVYKHDVSQARMAPLLDAVDEELGNLCDGAEPELHPLLARALLGATVDAMLRVLLHGGPNRFVWGSALVKTRWLIKSDVASHRKPQETCLGAD